MWFLCIFYPELITARAVLNVFESVRVLSLVHLSDENKQIKLNLLA